MYLRKISKIILLSLVLFLVSCSQNKQKVIVPPKPLVTFTDYASYNLWVDSKSIKKYSSPFVLSKLKEKGINTITIDVFDNFTPIIPLKSWKNNFLPAVNSPLSEIKFKKFISLCKEKNFHIWISINTLTIPKDLEKNNQGLFLRIKDWLMVDKDGSYKTPNDNFYFLCPNNPFVKEFFQNITQEFIQNYPSIEGVLFTGLRYPYLSNRINSSYCYCKYCTKIAHETYYFSLKGLTSDIENKSDYVYYLKLHNDSIKDFLKYIIDTTSKDRNIIFSMEIYLNYPEIKRTIFQNYKYLWQSIPNLQPIFTANYIHAFFDKIYKISSTFPPMALWGYELEPSLLPNPLKNTSDFIMLGQGMFAASTFLIDARSENGYIFANVLDTLVNQKTFYPFQDYSSIMENILKKEMYADYLTPLSKKYIVRIYTLWNKYKTSSKKNEKKALLKEIERNFLRALHLINVKNTPANKYLTLAYKYFLLGNMENF